MIKGKMKMYLNKTKNCNNKLSSIKITKYNQNNGLHIQIKVRR